MTLTRLPTPPGWPNAGSTSRFLAGILGRGDELAQIEGAIEAEEHDPQPGADIGALVLRRAELQRRRK